MWMVIVGVCVLAIAAGFLYGKLAPVAPVELAKPVAAVPKPTRKRRSR